MRKCRNFIGFSFCTMSLSLKSCSDFKGNVTKQSNGFQTSLKELRKEILKKIEQ
jgi:hypothetical protein